jgi:S1-C subfamily serine protease
VVIGVKSRKVQAKADVQKDDVILELDDIPTRTPDAFRRLLRARVAEGGDAAVLLRRDGKTFEVWVPCSD